MAEIEKILFSLEGESKNLTAKLDEINSKFQSVQGVIVKTSVAQKGLNELMTTFGKGSSINAQIQQLKQLSQTAESTKSKFSGFKEAIQNALGFAGGLGVVELFEKGLEKVKDVFEGVINSSAELSEKFEQQMKGMEFATKAFYRSIAEGDWSNLLDNMNEAYKRGVQYEEQMQTISKEQTSLNVINSKEMLRIEDLRVKAMDANVTDHKLRAKYAKDYLDAIDALSKREVVINSETISAKLNSMKILNDEKTKELSLTEKDLMFQKMYIKDVANPTIRREAEEYNKQLQAKLNINYLYVESLDDANSEIGQYAKILRTIESQVRPEQLTETAELYRKYYADEFEMKMKGRRVTQTLHNQEAAETKEALAKQKEAEKKQAEDLKKIQDDLKKYHQDATVADMSEMDKDFEKAKQDYENKKDLINKTVQNEIYKNSLLVQLTEDYYEIRRGITDKYLLIEKEAQDKADAEAFKSENDAYHKKLNEKAKLAEEESKKVNEKYLQGRKDELSILKQYGKKETDAITEVYKDDIKNLDIHSEAFRIRTEKYHRDIAMVYLNKTQLYVNVINEMMGLINQIYDYNISKLDKSISLQQQKVDQAKEIADKGNSAIYEAEKKRMEDLLKEKEKILRKQQALATIELVMNSMLAISKAAVENGPLAPFTIASTLIALAVGLIKAKQMAESAAFYEGGFTGNGDPRQVSTKLGKRGYTYHKEEFVFDHEKTNKYRSIFEQIHSGKMDLNEQIAKASLFDRLEMGRNMSSQNLIIKNANLTNGMEKKLDRIEQAILGQKTEMNFDENGLHIIASRIQFKKDRIRRSAR